MINSTSQNEFETNFKEKLLEVFKFTIEFLESHNLRWWAAYGTCLGAVRHHGMIPWDDDIDIMIPREDYNKLLQLTDEVKRCNYTLHSVKNGNSIVPYMKISENSSTIWQVKQWPVITGVWVDIFPLDYVDSAEEAKKQLKIYKKFGNSLARAHSEYDKEYWYFLFKGFHIKNIFLSFADICYYQRKIQPIEESFVRFEESLKLYGSQAVSFGAGFHVPEFIYETKWFDGYELLEFEGFKVRVPSGYHEYLSYCYGDYMTPPPVEKRVTHHEYFFIDIYNRYGIKEIRDKVNIR